MYESCLAAQARGRRGPPATAGLQRLRVRDGTARPLPLARWMREAGPEEQALLALAVGPVLDVGCGPGRHVAALVRRGVPALGIDLSAAAVLLARRRGGRAMRCCVWGDVPEAGTWRTVLLLDGNLGIRGDPESLLRRAREGAATRRTRMRLEADGRVSEWFDWALVSAADAGPLAAAAGLRVARAWSAGERRFARLVATADHS